MTDKQTASTTATKSEPMMATKSEPMTATKADATVDVKPAATGEQRLRRWDPVELFDELQQDMARLWSQTFPLLHRGHTGEERRVVLQRPDGSILRVPTEWTDLRAPDGYGDVARGRSRFGFPQVRVACSPGGHRHPCTTASEHRRKRGATLRH